MIAKYAGRLQLGDWLMLEFQAKALVTPSAPTAAPVVYIYDSSGTIVGTSWKMPPHELNVKTGMFRINILLGSSFSAGYHSAIVTYVISGTTYTESWHFQILPGGNAKGGYQGIHHYDTPHFDFIVGQTEDGTIEARKNPRVT